MSSTLFLHCVVDWLQVGQRNVAEGHVASMPCTNGGTAREHKESMNWFVQLFSERFIQNLHDPGIAGLLHSVILPSGDFCFMNSIRS